MAEYFGRLACWVDRQAGASSIPTGTEYPLHSKGNPHLRSVWHLTGYKVWSAGAEIGRLEGLLWINLLGILVISTQRPGIGLPAALCSFLRTRYSPSPGLIVGSSCIEADKGIQFGLLLLPVLMEQNLRS